MTAKEAPVLDLGLLQELDPALVKAVSPVLSHIFGNLAEIELDDSVEWKSVGEFNLHQPGQPDPEPSLQTSLDRFKAGDPSWLVYRETILQAAQMPAKAIAFIDEGLRLNSVPYLYDSHEPFLDMESKASYLESDEFREHVSQQFDTEHPVLPVRTVTVRFSGTPPRYTTVTSVGRNIDDRVRESIATDLGIQNPARVAKKGTRVNPSYKDFDPALMLGMLPGIVTPFFLPLRWDLKSYYVQNEHSSQSLVELPLDFRNSVVMEQGMFEGLMMHFAVAYRQDPVRMIQGKV